MTTKKLTKLLALYLPYLLLGLIATNFGEAWRLAEGKELGDMIMSMNALTKIKQDTFLSKFILISNPSRRWNRSLPDLSRRDGSLKKYHIDFLYAAARHRAEFYT